jgi:hypothetical protein
MHDDAANWDESGTAAVGSVRVLAFVSLMLWMVLYKLSKVRRSTSGCSGHSGPGQLWRSCTSWGCRCYSGRY